MISCVSFTGADDKVPVCRLTELTRAFAPTVAAEWAILYFPEKEGAPRNPSRPWRETFLAENLPHTAIHLCGSKVFKDILAGDTEVLAELGQYGRIQININVRRRLYTDDEVCRIYDALLTNGSKLILQHHAESSELVEDYLTREGRLARCGVLFDSSGGTGLLPAEWPQPLIVEGQAAFCGYAGGLGPDTIETELARIQAVAGARPFRGGYGEPGSDRQ